ncbi:MAG: hypothetical protein CVT84_08715 [Alphaproteobacteria bacterium HGW-Alphaproteobacteria-6]|nr:MAG: hypothetical protein CVT84_08715 [Alphaproteobacteria bacterium HGW-Alphaproteobacteria-6]
MRITPPDAFLRQPWRNGGGTTHEIAREEDAAGLLWRLSVAEVGSAGPFSAFPGLDRILTVIAGAGLILDTPEGRLHAMPFVPLGFRGDLPVDCRLIDGAVRDFNVIHDPGRIRAAVTVVRPGATLACPAGPGRHYAVLATGPGTRLDGVTLPAGALARFDAAGRLTGAEAPALLVTIGAVAA